MKKSTLNFHYANHPQFDSKGYAGDITIGAIFKSVTIPQQFVENYLERLNTKKILDEGLSEDCNIVYVTVDNPPKNIMDGFELNEPNYTEDKR